MIPLALDVFEIRIEPGILKVEDEIILPGNLLAQVESLRREIEEAYEGCQTGLVPHVDSLTSTSTSNINMKTDVLQLLVCKY